MSSTFRNILQQVTQEKLEELKIQKDLMTNHFKRALEKASEKSSTTNKETLQVLYEAVVTSPVKDTIDNILIDNLKHVLQNSRQDPSISPQLISAWVQKCQAEINFSIRKCEYSYLYGCHLSEWLEVEERKKSQQSEQGLQQTKIQKEQAIEKFQKLMFTQPSSQQFESEKFRKFLSEELFNFGDNIESENLMKEIRKETGEFFDVNNFYISTHDVQCCIKGLISEELLSEEKKTALKELNENQETLEEVASLLTTRVRNLSRWEWPSSSPGCELVEVRRGLAGEYKTFLNEDIITALFLHYVGVKWAAYFKNLFLKIYDSKMWTNVWCKDESIEQLRRDFHQSSFLTSLPDSLDAQESRHQEEYAKIEAKMFSSNDMVFGSSAAPPPPNFGFSTGATPPESLKRSKKKKKKVFATQIRPEPDIDFKQSFLHILSTEICLNHVLRPETPLIVVQADLESFGPSIIHNAPLTAFEHLGVPKHWLDFFKKFMQPKIKFLESDTTSQMVLRGVPTAHALSSMFGETLLFLLEFQINRKCNGLRIYRIQDEFWFWSHKTEDVAKAWETMNTYGEMVGLKVKENRSGSVSVYSEEALISKSTVNNLSGGGVWAICGPAPLPQRSIHWGYLALQSNGTFKIEEVAITNFRNEMKALLDKSECVLEWINVFNKYLAFFIRNFGKCALVSGKQHSDQIISALKIIYSGLFGSEDGCPLSALKQRYCSFKEENTVDAWAYWPLERGGLGLVNPFIGIMALRETYVDINDEDHFKKLPAQDRLLWEELKANHIRIHGHVNNPPAALAEGFSFEVGNHRLVPGLPPKFPTWEEYVQSRETELSQWRERYLTLLERPDPKSPTVSNNYWTMDQPMPREENDANYLQWLFTYYETQLVLHFGTVTFINSKLLPMSMIANIQKSKLNI